MSPAGGVYGGLIPAFFRFGRLADHFLGRWPGRSGSKPPLLGCQCGEWGCWPLLARIRAVADSVIWDQFEQPHRPSRDYGAFGPFTFERQQYERALDALDAVADDG
jgi:hypothetical protein